MAAPVINLTTTGAKGLTNVDNAEATTNWAGFRHAGGGSPSVQSETNVFVQGSAANSIKVSGTSRDEGLWYTNVGSVDLTTDANKHVYAWAACIDMAQLDAIASGGLYIIVGSSTGNWNKYYVAGSDTIDGRFVRYVIDVTKPPSETAATAATLTAVTHIGIGCKSASITAKTENLVCDRVDYGTGWQIEEGDATTPCSWQEAFEIDDNSSNKYGVLQKESNGTFTLLGGITFGDPAGTVSTLWDDTSGSVVKFKNPVYHNGDALVSSVDSTTLYELEVLGNGTGTTDITFGQFIGTGDDRQGLGGGLIGTDGPKWSWDSETDISDLDTVEFYGVSCEGAGIMAFDSVTKTEIIGCTFANCDELQPNLADWVNNTVIAPVPDRGLEMVASSNVEGTTLVSGITGQTDTRPAIRCWQVDVSATPDAFVEYTDEFASAATGDVVPFPASEAAGDYFAIGSDRIFNGINIDVGTARSGGAIVWAYWNGSWTTRTLAENDTSGLTVTGPGLTAFVPADDWEKTSLHGEEPLYYMRIEVGTAFTTNPIFDEGSITRIEEHLLHYPVSGSETAQNMVCFGEAIHVENSDDATALDSYPDSNGSVNQSLNNGFYGRAQSFASGAGGTLTSATFYMDTEGSPTGDVQCHLYAHSGTFGTSSVPTGSALASSNIKEAADFPSAPGLGLVATNPVTFEFEDEYSMAAATNYVIAVEYSNGTVSNFLRMRSDNTSPTHGGNQANQDSASAWSAASGFDLCFSLNSGGLLELTLAGGAIVTTDANTGAPPGATIILNNIQVTFDEMQDNTEVRIYEAGTSNELDGIENATAGSPGNRNFAASVAATTSVDYWIFNVDYEVIFVTSFTWPSTDQTIIVQQRVDRNFENP